MAGRRLVERATQCKYVAMRFAAWHVVCLLSLPLACRIMSCCSTSLLPQEASSRVATLHSPSACSSAYVAGLDVAQLKLVAATVQGKQQGECAI